MKIGLLIATLATMFCRLNIFAALICAALAVPFWSRNLIQWAGICALSAVIWWIIGMVGASLQPSEPPPSESAGTPPPKKSKLP